MLGRGRVGGTYTTPLGARVRKVSYGNILHQLHGALAANSDDDISQRFAEKSSFAVSEVILRPESVEFRGQ